MLMHWIKKTKKKIILKKKRNIFLIILAFIVSTFFAIILTNYYINKKQKELLNSIYESTHKNIFEKTQNLINDKQNTSLAIAISLSKDETLYAHLKNKDFEKLNYIKIAKLIETNSKYKNIWIQIFDSNLNSVYRSWTNIRGSSNFRPDLKKIEALKNISTSISAGLFNIGIKAMIMKNIFLFLFKTIFFFFFKSKLQGYKIISYL